jgi:hypothetical protein
MSSRPSKIIRTELQSMTEENLVPTDIKRVAKAVYRSRCKNHPPLPKSREETLINLSKMNILTNKADSFLAVNADNNVIIFTCQRNIECLCDVDEIFMDGTFKCCPKFFQQMYTVTNMETTYQLCLSYCQGNPMIFIDTAHLFAHSMSSSSIQR